MNTATFGALVEYEGDFHTRVYIPKVCVVQTTCKFLLEIQRLNYIYPLFENEKRRNDP